jgi:FAD/FMN-containing dehydrogenase
MPGEFALFAVGIPMTPEIGAAVHAHLPKVMRAMAQWDAGTAYLNFAGDSVDPAKFYSPENYARLRRVKAEVDPAGLFRGNHAISAD